MGYVISELLDRLKKRSPFSGDEIDIDKVLLIENNTPDLVHGQNEMLAQVRLAISQLAFKHRQVVTLIDIESFTYAEVAEIIDVPLGTIMSRLNRARQSLRHTLNSPENNSKETKLKVVQ